MAFNNDGSVKQVSGNPRFKGSRTEFEVLSTFSSLFSVSPLMWRLGGGSSPDTHSTTPTIKGR
jgi:hypothetical protein